jgi:hypothetical protein
MSDGARALSAHHVSLIEQDVDAALAELDASLDGELSLIYGDDAEPSDTVLFDLLDSDPDPCPDHPGGHLYLGRCGETRCLHCGRVVG